MDSSDYYLTDAAIQATIERSSPTEIDDDPALEAHAQLMDAREIAALLVVSERTVWRLQEEGQLPQPVRISKRVTRWRYSEIMQHIDELRPIGAIDRKGPRRSTSSPPN